MSSGEEFPFYSYVTNTLQVVLLFEVDISSLKLVKSL